MEKRTATRCDILPYAANSLDELGPFPATSVAALADLGLSDQEIAQYFHTFRERIAHIRVMKAPELPQVCAHGFAVPARPIWY